MQRMRLYCVSEWVCRNNSSPARRKKDIKIVHEVGEGFNGQPNDPTSRSDSWIPSNIARKQQNRQLLLIEKFACYSGTINGSVWRRIVSSVCMVVEGRKKEDKTGAIRCVCVCELSDAFVQNLCFIQSDTIGCERLPATGLPRST